MQQGRYPFVVVRHRAVVRWPNPAEAANEPAALPCPRGAHPGRRPAAPSLRGGRPAPQHRPDRARRRDRGAPAGRGAHRAREHGRDRLPLARRGLGRPRLHARPREVRGRFRHRGERGASARIFVTPVAAAGPPRPSRGPGAAWRRDPAACRSNSSRPRPASPGARSCSRPPASANEARLAVALSPQRSPDTPWREPSADSEIGLLRTLRLMLNTDRGWRRAPSRRQIRPSTSASSRRASPAASGTSRCSTGSRCRDTTTDTLGICASVANHYRPAPALRPGELGRAGRATGSIRSAPSTLRMSWSPAGPRPRSSFSRAGPTASRRAFFPTMTSRSASSPAQRRIRARSPHGAPGT